MQHTTKYEQNDKTDATQPNINKTINAMPHTIKYQQTDKTHATHNQISATRLKPQN